MSPFFALSPFLAPNGLANTFTQVFDTQSRLVAWIDPLGNATSLAYNAANQVVSTTSPVGAVWSTSYDSLQRVLAQVDPLGHVVSHAYDAAGNPVGTTNPLSAIWTRIFDAAGRLVARLDPLGNRSSVSYDTANRPVAVTNALGRTGKLGLRRQRPAGRHRDRPGQRDNRGV